MCCEDQKPELRQGSLISFFHDRNHVNFFPSGFLKTFFSFTDVKYICLLDF